MNVQNLGENIKKYQKKLNLTQAELAEMSGISVVYLRQIEQGSKIPKLETLIRIAKALDTTLDALLFNSSEKEEYIDLYGLSKRMEKIPEKCRVKIFMLFDFIVQLSM